MSSPANESAEAPLPSPSARRKLPASLIAAVYLAASTAFLWPVLRRLASALPHDSGDPVLNTLILWWSTVHLPFTSAWWNAPIFYPTANAMALSELLVGLLPISAAVQFMTGNPAAAYNAAFVLSFPLCACGAYLLAHELTGRRDAALLAGLAFAFAPYRMQQLSHLQMLSYYWAPVALFALHRYVRAAAASSSREWWWLLLFATAWLLQSLSNGYALFHLSVLVALWLVWFVRDRRMVPILIAWALAAAPLAFPLLKYRRVHAYLHLARDINEIKRFGVDLADFLSAPVDLQVWGRVLGSARPETAMFPGLTLIVVAATWFVVEWWFTHRKRSPEPQTADRRVLIALSAAAAVVAMSVFVVGPWRLGPLTVTNFAKPFSIAVALRLLAALRSGWMRRAWTMRSVPVFYALAMAALYVLALGPEPRLLGRPFLYRPPYTWLMVLPGFDTLRVPARFAMLAVLCQAMLLAMFIARARARAWRQSIVVAVIGVGLLADGWVHLAMAPLPAAGPVWKNVQAVIELPPGDGGAVNTTGPSVDFGAMYRAMQHTRPVVNGYSGFNPPHYLPLIAAIRDRQISTLHELVPRGELGVAIDLARADAAELDSALGVLEGVERRTLDSRWSTFVVHGRVPPVVRMGARLAVARVESNRNAEDLDRLADGDVETAWGTGLPQIGGEEVTVDLGSTKAVGSIVLEMGAYAFGFPRALEIDRSTDGTTWEPVYGGRPAPQMVRGAVADPSRAPLTFDFVRVDARYVRLRQTGEEPGVPWWIAELKVFAPAP